MVPILSQINSVHTILSYLSKIHILLSTHLRYGLLSGVDPFRATCPADLIFYGLIIAIITDQEYKLWYSSILTFFNIHNNNNNNNNNNNEAVKYGYGFCMTRTIEWLRCKLQTRPIDKEGTP
jgi:hypothetical protein